MKKYLLEVTVFLSGAVVMMLELTGSRILAPFVGTSTFIWTSLIGVILASLSFGYYHGGIEADKDPSVKRLARILFWAGISIGVVAVAHQTVLAGITSWLYSMRWSAVLSACILFGIPAYLLGMVSPQAVRIRMKDLSTSGATIGRLYALSSVGSIVGTFLVGFYLMSWLGSRNIMFILSGLSLLLALLNQMNRDTGIALLIFVAAPFVQSFGKNNLLNIIDTEYCAVQVVTGPYPDAQSPVCKIMKVGNEYSSGMYLDSDSLAFVYSRFYKLMFHFHPNPQNTLLIGGGAYSVPKYFHQVHPEMHMDVLEIDPALTEIARKDFRLKTDERLVPIHEDGRIFLNKNKKQYDVIMGDAYRSLFNIPFHLVTQEAMEKMATSLKPDGILMVNILSPVTGPNRDLLQSMIRTCKAVFPEVKAFKPRVKESPDRVQNIMLVCAKQTPMYSGSKVSPEIQSMLAQEIDLKTVGFENGLVLRDDYAPVEHYAEKMLRSYFHQ